MLLHSIWRYILWLIRSVLLVSAAALALMLAPWALSLRVMIVTSSMPVPAWTAVLAAIPAPTALSAPLNNRARKTTKRVTGQRPPDTRKHTVLPVSIRLKSTEKTPTCVSMRAFLQPISARIYFGKTASHRKRARFVQSRGASPQAYWMSVKAAQRRGCAKRAFCGVCFLVPGGLSGVFLFGGAGGIRRLFVQF